MEWKINYNDQGIGQFIASFLLIIFVMIELFVENYFSRGQISQ